jgi:Holliday junction resolvasome RuvABC endonuclease subunit
VKVIAFDLSLTATGWARGVSGAYTDAGLLPGKGDGVRRLMYLRNAVCAKVETSMPDLVVFEDFSFGSSDGKAFERAGLAYMIRAELVSDQIPYVLCSPMSLKKFVCGTAGSAKAPIRKEHMLKFLATRFGHDVDDNNVCDAIGLAYVGMALVEDWPANASTNSALTVAQKQVLEKLRQTNKEVKLGNYIGDYIHG